jgi:hypothetical protein
MKMDWKSLTEEELKIADSSRYAGNEGKARVCARRAAGYIANEYLKRKGIQLQTNSALSRIRYLISIPDITLETKTILEHFLIHTTPEHKLPVDVDLIEEVYWMANELLDESIR